MARKGVGRAGGKSLVHPSTGAFAAGHNACHTRTGLHCLQLKTLTCLGTIGRRLFTLSLPLMVALPIQAKRQNGASSSEFSPCPTAAAGALRRPTTLTLSGAAESELKALDVLAARNTGAPNLYLLDPEVTAAVDDLVDPSVQRGLRALDETNDGVWEARAPAPSTRQSRLAKAA